MVRQRFAKPSTPVQIRSAPPEYFKTPEGVFLFFEKNQYYVLSIVYHPPPPPPPPPPPEKPLPPEPEDDGFEAIAEDIDLEIESN